MVYRTTRERASHIGSSMRMQGELRSPILNVCGFIFRVLTWRKLIGQTELRIPENFDLVEVIHVRLPFQMKTVEFDSKNVSGVRSIAFLEMIWFVNLSRAEPRPLVST